MDTKALRQKVLDLAIRGKLVPQDPNDEPASVLLERIRQEKQQMLKEGKLKPKDIKNDSVIFKGDDNLHYEKFANGTVECIEDEIPFTIPKSWAWCRIQDFAQVRGGKRLPKGSSFSNSVTSHGYIRVVDMKNNSIIQDNIKYINDDVYEKIKNYTISSKDIYVTIAGSIGVVGEIPENNDGMNLTENAAKITNIKIDKSYLCFVLQSDFVQKQFRFKTFQVAMPKLALERILTTFIPVPPLDEQKRICKTVSHALYISKEIEHYNNSLNNTVALLKSRILNLAVRGKLVPQNPDDEPASVLLERIRAEKGELIKQGKIKRDKNESVIFKGDDNSYYEKIDDSVVCVDDELPYDIPENWAYIRLKSILNYEQPTPYIVESTAYSNDYETPVLTAGKSFIIGYTDETEGIKADLPVIIFDDFTTESKYVDFPFKVKSSAMKILTADERIISTLYAYYAMQKVDCDSENHKRYWISEFSEKIIGLPPLEEQIRIISRIKEIEELFK